MGKVALRGLILLAVIGALGVASFAVAGGGAKTFKTNLDGYEENPDVSTPATGSFKAFLSDDGNTLEYELEYSGISGGTTSAAHIHFGKRAVNGGVSVFLCSGGDKPACPATGGTVTGTIDAADVIGPSGQGIAAGELAELVAAMRAGHAYVNVHSTGGTPAWPGGEIRGQINDRGRN
jgi:hypothetical protein